MGEATDHRAEAERLLALATGPNTFAVEGGEGNAAALNELREAARELVDYLDAAMPGLAQRSEVRHLRTLVRER